jgi:2-methylisocitrate lyase-like PEP mutase family enzyme
VSRLDGAPLNLLAAPSLPPLPRLRELGVRRLSTGSSLYRLALASAARAYGSLLESGLPQALAGEAGLPYADLTALLTDGARRGPSPEGPVA